MELLDIANCFVPDFYYYYAVDIYLDVWDGFNVLALLVFFIC